jgi:hypothetical protein
VAEVSERRITTLRVRLPVHTPAQDGRQDA